MVRYCKEPTSSRKGVGLASKEPSVAVRTDFADIGVRIVLLSLSNKSCFTRIYIVSILKLINMKTSGMRDNLETKKIMEGTQVLYIKPTSKSINEVLKETIITLLSSSAAFQFEGERERYCWRNEKPSDVLTTIRNFAYYLHGVFAIIIGGHIVHLYHPEKAKCPIKDDSAQLIQFYCPWICVQWKSNLCLASAYFPVVKIDQCT